MSHWLTAFNSFELKQTHHILSVLSCQKLPSRTVVMRDPPPRITVSRDHYRLSDDYWKWKDTDRHPSSICSFSLTLTGIMSYIKSWQNAAPTLSAVGLSSQGAQTADRDIILSRNACRAHLPREDLPPCHDVLWGEGLTGSLWLDIVPKDHSGINYPGHNSSGVICLDTRESSSPFTEEQVCAPHKCCFVF